MTTETTSVLETPHLPQGRKRASIRKEILHHIAAGETQLSRFIRGYLIAALWSSVDDEGDPLDNSFGIRDISTESLVSAWAECSQFCRECIYYLSYLDDEQNGHDFWLTRCCHGAGFWDRKIEDEGGAFAMQLLTEASHTFGEIDIYIGDDRQLHFSNERRVV